MNKNEVKMISLLKELKKNHFACGIKLEFEAEGTRFEEAIRLKIIAAEAGLPLNIKIGGCEAIRDMIDAETLGASRIIAPMVESDYALSKFLQAANTILNSYAEKTELFINVETIHAVNCFDEMLKNKAINQLKGVVIGRVDLVHSMGLDREYINHEKTLSISKDIAKKASDNNLEVVVGGGVSIESLPFFKSFPKNHLTRFETRKVMFSYPDVISSSGNAFSLANEFELLWLKNKKEHYVRIASEDEQRLIMLKERLKSNRKQSAVEADL